MIVADSSEYNSARLLSPAYLAERHRCKQVTLKPHHNSILSQDYVRINRTIAFLAKQSNKSIGLVAVNTSDRCIILVSTVNLSHTEYRSYVCVCQKVSMIS